MKAKITITDDKGNVFEGLMELFPTKNISPKEDKSKDKSWFKPNSTIAKITELINEGFLDQNKTIKEIIDKLQSKDYHFKASDLTLPLRKIVRKGLLNKVKSPDKKQTKWSYVKA